MSTDTIKLPLRGDQRTVFKTKTGLLVAKGYSRVVIGSRGSYVEFDDEHLLRLGIKIPETESWRVSNKNAYYVGYRTLDEASVKIYLQKRLVAYADYKIGKWYIAVDDLFVDGKRCEI